MKSLWLWKVTTRRPLNSGSCGKSDCINLIKKIQQIARVQFDGYANHYYIETGNKRYLLMKNDISKIGKNTLDSFLPLFIIFFIKKKLPGNIKVFQ